MSTKRKYNNPQDIDINTLTEVLDLFTDFCFALDGWRLEHRFTEFFGERDGSHFYRKLVEGPSQVISAGDIVALYSSMTLGNRKKFVRLILEDRFKANKDYLTALPLDHRPSSGGNPIFAPFESLEVAFDTLAQKDMILAGQLAQTLTDLTAITFRREGVQS